MGVFRKKDLQGKPDTFRWIEYYINGRRKRERIGPNKRLAETVLRKHTVDVGGF